MTYFIFKNLIILLRIVIVIMNLMNRYYIIYTLCMETVNELVTNSATILFVQIQQ